MRVDTVKTDVYKYDELTDEAKQRAIEKMYSINVDHEWWNYIYDDAGNVSLKITAFDIDRASYVTAEWLDTARVTAEAILENHGNKCESFKTATEFMKEWGELVEKYSDGVKLDKVTEENEYEFDQEADELEDEFLKSLQEDYLQMLRNDYEHNTSDEAIIETIEANEYEFEEDGTQY